LASRTSSTRCARAAAPTRTRPSRSGRNAPLGLLSLDRLVSLRDYADFARAFAGIGKASAAKLSDGQREMVHVTIAGLDDVPILPSSDLFVNLQSAFSLLGDARQPVQLAVRELVLLVIAARVRVAENYSWKLVEPHVRAALLEAFGSERRDLGQPVASSEVIGTIARVPGVEFVDLDVFGGIPEVVPDVVAAGATPARHAISRRRSQHASRRGWGEPQLPTRRAAGCRHFARLPRASLDPTRMASSRRPRSRFSMLACRKRSCSRRSHDAELRHLHPRP
jgi:hypothetical protein